MSVASSLLSIKSSLPEHCKLIAVSKTQPVAKILEAYHTDHRLFGENKVQELTSKAQALPPDIDWHMIGHLQSNKVRHLAPIIGLIHGVDSPRLLVEIDKQAGKNKRVIRCLLQVHIAREETKFGFSETEILSLITSHEIAGLKNIRIEGLMGMATFTDHSDQIRAEFKSLKMLFEKIKLLPRPASIAMNELSMGMSNDYRIAVDEGSTMVRIGTAIFGERITGSNE